MITSVASRGSLSGLTGQTPRPRKGRAQLVLAAGHDGGERDALARLPLVDGLAADRLGGVAQGRFEALAACPPAIRYCGHTPARDFVVEPGRVTFTNFDEGIKYIDPYSSALWTSKL
jgi:hypothetical protein